MAAAGRNFSVIHKKMLHCRFVCMCPTMDLVASLHADGQLAVHRTMGWQRSFTLTKEDMGNRTLSCVTWSPNGKTLAVGYSDGTLQLFGVETGAEECSLAFHEGRALAALTWVAQQPRQGAARSRADEEEDRLAEVAAAYADRCDHVLGPCDRLPGAGGRGGGAGVGGRSSEYGSQAEDGFSLLQGMKERPVSVLASADAAGVVVLSICGAYRLITIDLRAHRRPDPAKGKGRASPGRVRVDSPRQRRARRSSGQDSVMAEGDGDADGIGAGPGLRPLQLTLSADLSVLTALVEVEGHVELIQVDLPLLWRQRHELKPLAMHFTAFTAVVGRLAVSAPRLPQLWKTSLKGLEAKLGNLEELLPRFGYHKDITARDELIHLVTCGYASGALTQFLSTVLTDVQLARMRKAVDTGTGQVEAMLRGDVSILARTLLFRACDLHRLVIARAAEGDGGDADGDAEGVGAGGLGLGLGPAAVEQFLRDCEMLCVQVEQTLRDVQASRSRLRFVLLWLEQMAGIVANDDGGDVGGGEGEPPHPPCLTLANSILTILREPLPTDEQSSSSPGAAAAAAGVSPARSRVESVIGTSVPGLAADGDSAGPVAAGGAPSSGTGRKDRFIVLDEDPALASRTIQEQVRRLEASVAEVFKTPRDRLSPAVANVTCARLCPSSEGGGADLVRTRAAARAAAAAAGGSPPLVSMRACMCFQEKLPLGRGERDGRRGDAAGTGGDRRGYQHHHHRGSGGGGGRGGGIVVATVAPDNSRGGKGLDVVWVTVVPMRAIPISEEGEAASGNGNGGGGGGARDPMRVTGVRSPPGFQVRQVAFYGSVPGVPTQNEGRLAIVLEPTGAAAAAAAAATTTAAGVGAGAGAASTSLHLLDLDELHFTEVGSLASFDDRNSLASPGRKSRGGSGGGGGGGGAGGAGAKDVVGAARGRGAEAPPLTELSGGGSGGGGRSRELPAHVKGVTVALSGARGMACAVSASKHLVVFDLEEDEEEEDEEDEDEEEEEEEEEEEDEGGQEE